MFGYRFALRRMRLQFLNKEFANQHGAPRRGYELSIFCGGGGNQNVELDLPSIAISNF